jgi:hypothetical protein
MIRFNYKKLSGKITNDRLVKTDFDLISIANNKLFHEKKPAEKTIKYTSVRLGRNRRRVMALRSVYKNPHFDYSNQGYTNGNLTTFAFRGLLRMLINISESKAACSIET